MAGATLNELTVKSQVVEARFDDIDAMAASAVEWNQEYEQIGRGRFQGRLTQLVLNSLQLGREAWSPGILQRDRARLGAAALNRKANRARRSRAKFLRIVRIFLQWSISVIGSCSRLGATTSHV